MTRRILPVVLGSILTATLGCGAKYPDTAVVRGTVTVGNRPLESGRIIFFPQRGNQATGEIVDGNYELRTFAPGDGAVPGNYRVTISAVQILRGKPREVSAPPGASQEQIRSLMMEAASEQLRWHAPQRYSVLSQTTLVAEVVADKENRIDFALDTK